MMDKADISCVRGLVVICGAPLLIALCLNSGVGAEPGFDPRFVFVIAIVAAVGYFLFSLGGKQRRIAPSRGGTKPKI
ncbi:MAG TPA: hypothetical protein V6C89_15010 [Drouetiella sp.]